MSPIENTCVFEGAEKRIEISFSQNISSPNGLRALNRSIWDEVCAKCKCEIIQHERREGFDSFILSESSLFVFPTRVIMKTCGTTVPLNGIDLIVRHAVEQGLLPLDMTYSRASFLFPDLQAFPHDSLQTELEFLLSMNIAGMVVPGKSSILGDPCGKHWLVHRKQFQPEATTINVNTPDHRSGNASADGRVTVDIIMTGLSPEVCEGFFKNFNITDFENEAQMTNRIKEVLPEFADITGKTYNPCGYSANGFGSESDHPERCFTVHVTPESDFSYASFEAVFYPALTRSSSPEFCLEPDNKSVCQIKEFVQRALSAFRPENALVTVLAGDERVSAAMLPSHFSQTPASKLKYCYFSKLFTSDNLLGEDIVASSVYYSGVSSGNTGTKPTGLS